MKTMRILLMAAFLFAAFANTAQAQETDPEVGFLPLAYDVNSTLPQRGQWAMAYQQMMPLLSAAQRDGTILAFNPEFAVGAVRVTYAKGTIPPTLAGQPVYANLADAVKMMPRAAEEQAITKAYDPHFVLMLYTSCPHIYGLIEGDRVVGILRDKYGETLAVYESYANANGQAHYECFHGRFSALMPGYRVIFKIYNSAGALRGSYRVAIPSITFKAIDRVNSIVNGTGLADKPYVADWQHRNLDANHTYIMKQVNGTFSSAGNWAVDFGETKFRGGDYLGINVNPTSRFTIRHSMYVPYAYCVMGDNYCGLHGFSNQPATMTITHGGTPYTFTGKFSLYRGWFTASLVDANGYPIFLEAGDIVAGTGIQTLRLANLTAAFNFDADTISGKAPPNKYISVFWLPEGGSMFYEIWVRTNASGDYVADLSGITDLISTQVYSVSISYTDPVTGNSTHLYQIYAP